MRRLVSIAVLALTLTACGGGDEEAEGSAPSESATTSAPTEDEPQPTTVTVELRDGGQVGTLANGDGGKCVSINLADALSVTMENPNATPDEVAALLPTVTVELADADGTTIGLEELPREGGTFTRGAGCVWPLTFDVDEESDFYEVTVSKGDEVVATEQSSVSTLVVSF